MEPGLERKPAAVWRYKEQLTVESNETLLVQYAVSYQPDQKHFRLVADPRVYETQYRSPQLPLWQFGDDEWLKILRLPPRPARRKHSLNGVVQEQLFA